MMVNFNKDFSIAKNYHQQAKSRTYLMSSYVETKVCLGGTALLSLRMSPIKGWLSTGFYPLFKKKKR